MTKKLDELFNVESEEIQKELSKEIVVVDNNNAVASVSDVDLAILELIDVNQHGQEMDQIAKTALEGYEEVMELSRNVDERTASGVLQAAISMQRNAIDALNNKAKAKMKAAEILMKKKAMDANAELELADIIDNQSETVIGDRNDVLKKINNGEL